MTDRNKEIGRCVRRYREKLGMTQKQLAEAVGYSTYVGVSTIERGAGGIPAEKLKAFSEALGVPITALIGTDNDVEPQRNSGVPPDILAKLKRRPVNPAFWDAVRTILDEMESAGKRTPKSGSKKKSQRTPSHRKLLLMKVDEGQVEVAARLPMKKATEGNNS